MTHNVTASEGFVTAAGRFPQGARRSRRPPDDRSALTTPVTPAKRRIRAAQSSLALPPRKPNAVCGVAPMHETLPYAFAAQQDDETPA